MSRSAACCYTLHIRSYMYVFALYDVLSCPRLRTACPLARTLRITESYVTIKRDAAVDIWDRGQNAEASRRLVQPHFILRPVRPRSDALEARPHRAAGHELPAQP